MNAGATALLRRARVNLGEALEAEAPAAEVLAVAIAAVRRHRLPSVSDVDDASDALDMLGIDQ